MNPNLSQFATSQLHADCGPRSSSVPSRCSEPPGGATHFGSGCRANSAACSALLRKALTTIRWLPAASAARAMRSNASAVSGRIGFPWRYANGPLYSPSPPVTAGTR